MSNLLGRYTRAFLLAGAPTVLCSLWKVDDAATRVLMETFYSLWNAKDPGQRLSAGEALARAQSFVREQEGWSHPKFWSGFVLWGRAD